MFREEASILGPVIIVIIIIVNKMVVINICLALNYLAATQLEEGDIRKRR